MACTCLFNSARGIVCIKLTSRDDHAMEHEQIIGMTVGDGLGNVMK